MGFHRQGQPAALDRSGIAAIVTRFLAEEIELTKTAPHDCPNPAGHDYRATCGFVACVHCERLAWA